MSIFVMSDIHGEKELFYQMLQHIAFSDDDTLYILGDVIDRGPDGIALLQEIKDRRNIFMLLGNHEHMMLQCYCEQPSGFDCLRWRRNGNEATVKAFRRLDLNAQRSMLQYLRELPTHIEVYVDGIPYYLVHGFPADCADDEVWERPELYAQNPKPGYRVVVGHTPVLNLVVPREERQAYIRLLQKQKDHPRILFARGFIDVDCGCSYSAPMKTLGCLRLDDLSEYYVHSRYDAMDMNVVLQKSIV